MLVRAGVCLVGTSKRYDLLACSIVSIAGMRVCFIMLS